MRANKSSRPFHCPTQVWTRGPFNFANLKSLNIRPKTFYNEYLSGATNKAMPPIPYAFISLAIVSYLSSILINLNVGLSGSEIFEVEDLWFQNFTIWIAVYYVVISLIYFLSKYNFLESLIFSLFAVPQLQFYIITGDLFCYIFELNGELNSLLYLLIIVFFIVGILFKILFTFSKILIFFPL